ncbi:MAG: prolyl-tRNA synthetase associated domain-containing protein [Pseudomonadota bacterium]
MSAPPQEDLDAGSPPPTTEAALLAELDRLDLPWRVHRHPAVFTVEESRAHRGDLPGVHVKNMVLKDKKNGLWLVTCREDRRIRIKELERALGAPKMSFAKPEILWSALGVRPGAVTPLAMINDRDPRAVTIVLDAQMMAEETLNAHPLHNEATLNLATADLIRALEAWDRPPRLLDFDALEAASAADPA